MRARHLQIILLIAPAFAWAWQPAKDCRANIAKVVCRIEAGKIPQEKDPREVTTCLGGEEEYIREITKVHDDLPPKLKKMFCHLRKIYIGEDFGSTAYSWRVPEVFRDKQNREMIRFNGNSITLDKKVLFDSKADLTEWFVRKDQVLFGRASDHPPSPLMPKMNMSFGRIKSIPKLLMVMIHEFGHHFDHNHKFNRRIYPEDPECFALSDVPAHCRQIRVVGAWPSLSWLPDQTIRTEDQFIAGYRTCFYKCDNPTVIAEDSASNFYRLLLNGDAFVSSYATVNPFEDFAESFLYYIAETYFKEFDVAMLFPDGESRSLKAKKREGRVAAKMEFMSMFDRIPWKYEPDVNETIPLENP